jgi:hypothetical protein
MSSPNLFNTTEPDLLPILAELISREPIFHRPAFASTNEDFARMTAPTYWEVGASGRRYTRDYILQTLADTPPIDAAKAGWQVIDPQCRRLGPENSDTYLLTYTLHQAERRTRRATIWQQTPSGWQILYHQGTSITTEDDDTSPNS